MIMCRMTYRGERNADEVQDGHVALLERDVVVFYPRPQEGILQEVIET